MKASTDLRPVIVLGAGPVGLGAELELARCGIRSILIEGSDRTSWQRIRHVGFEPTKDSSIDDATWSMRDEYEKLGDLVKSRGINVQ